jgi:hypothetical protein
MPPLAELAIAIMLPTVACYAILSAFRGYRRLAEARSQAPAAESMQRVEARLRRLRAELELTEARPGGTAKNHRVRAVRGAYLDVLSAACMRLDISPPEGGDRARQADIYQAEARLRQRGVDVRAAATH